VFFGTSNPPAFRVTQTGANYSPGLLLAPLTTYYWRIDSRNACVTTPGLVWSFVTSSFTGDFDNDTDIDQSDFAFMQKCFSGDANAFASGCAPADFDADGDVDSSDFNSFLPCMLGANRPSGC
jgi:hypothetical protein